MTEQRTMENVTAPFNEMPSESRDAVHDASLDFCGHRDRRVCRLLYLGTLRCKRFRTRILRPLRFYSVGVAATPSRSGSVEFSLEWVDANASTLSRTWLPPKPTADDDGYPGSGEIRSFGTVRRPGCGKSNGAHGLRPRISCGTNRIIDRTIYSYFSSTTCLNVRAITNNARLSSDLQS